MSIKAHYSTKSYFLLCFFYCCKHMLIFSFCAVHDIYLVEELQCLASWKEGSSRYFLGLISYQHHASYEERFRCFVYERSKHGHSHHNSSPKHHPHSLSLHSRGGVIEEGDNSTNFPSGGGEHIYRVAQSGDPSCNGLSSMEGSRTMVLRRGKHLLNILH